MSSPQTGFCAQHRGTQKKAHAREKRQPSQAEFPMIYVDSLPSGQRCLTPSRGPSVVQASRLSFEDHGMERGTNTHFGMSFRRNLTDSTPQPGDLGHHPQRKGP